jgi:hypothetical protein
MWIQRKENNSVTLTRIINALLEKNMVNQWELVYWLICWLLTGFSIIGLSRLILCMFRLTTSYWFVFSFTAELKMTTASPQRKCYEQWSRSYASRSSSQYRCIAQHEAKNVDYFHFGKTAVKSEILSVLTVDASSSSLHDVPFSSSEKKNGYFPLF